MRIEAVERRSGGFETARGATNHVDRLDWEAFSAAYFPGRRRHDLEALTAYSAYSAHRYSHALDSRTSAEPVGIEARHGPADATALRDWEDDGGAAG
jgi:hypothetical protein